MKTLAEQTREAMAILKETNRASMSMLQRRLKVGCTRAASILDALENNGIVGPANGSQPREIFPAALTAALASGGLNIVEPSTGTTATAAKEEPEQPDKSASDEPHIERSTGSRLLKCSLTAEERLEYGQEMADAYQALADIQGEFETVKQEFKGKIGGQESSITRLSALIRAGYEHRQVKTEIVKDFERLLLTVHRVDTGELVESRPMTDQEAQMTLPLAQP